MTYMYATGCGSLKDQGRTFSSSLTYLVDTTGSMGDDFLQLKMVNSWLLDSITTRFPCGVRQYTMVEFNDPGVGPVRTTYSRTEFQNFFDGLLIYGGGDCPELAMTGLKLALENSPSNSIILVLTDASALDYNNVTLINSIRLLINSTRSQVFFLITGLCAGVNDPGFLIYREIAAQSFGLVFQVSLSDLGKVFNYMDITLSRPANSSTRLFSRNFDAINHSDNFTLADNFTDLLVATDGLIYSIRIVGPGYTNTSTTSRCSDCDPNAMCEEYFDHLECTCKDGFIGDGFRCSDINECAYSWSNNCSAGICLNTFGSYKCVCPSGYINGSGNSCVDVNECSTPSLNRCHPSATCINSIGSYSCVCPPGLYGDGFSCEINECSKGACGFAMDCTKYMSSYSCSDPCLNHTVLNEPWRSTSNNVSSSIICDYDKSGWYRFVGSGGVRMPETCVPELSCNTHAPMWLRGSHPVLSDGIVNRTACAHWSGNCCLWSTTVQIKACSGGYHVYKLSGTPACSLTYCTVQTVPHSSVGRPQFFKLPPQLSFPPQLFKYIVNEECASRGRDPVTSISRCSCTDDEVCNVDNGDYRCDCKDKYKVSALSDVSPVMTCGTKQMKASFRKCQLSSLDISVGDLVLQDSSGCFVTQDDNIANMYSVLAPLQAGRNETHATYTSEFVFTINDGIISRDELKTTMSCVYPLDMKLSLDLAINPIYKTVLYVGLSLNDPDSSQYAIVMKNCYATPSASPDDPVKYYIIKNSCPNKQDKTINVAENGVGSQAKFSLQLFTFVGNYSSVHLHCELYLCDNRTSICIPSCSGARSADESTDPTVPISVGPISRGDYPVDGSRISALTVTVQELQSNQAHLQQQIQDLQLGAPAPSAHPTASGGPPVSGTEPPHVSDPRIPLPDRFNGDRTKYRTFITSCELLFAINPLTYSSDFVKVRTAIALLSGEPQSWGHHQLQINSPVLTSWNEFRLAMDALYEDPFRSSSAQTALRSLSQGKRPVEDYVAEFRCLSCDTNWNEAALYDQFHIGLTDGLKDELARVAPPSSLEELIRLSVSIDRRLRER
ncbi:uromodulin-like [Rhinophrynus dorsalis]